MPTIVSVEKVIENDFELSKFLNGDGVDAMSDPHMRSPFVDLYADLDRDLARKLAYARSIGCVIIHDLDIHFANEGEEDEISEFWATVTASYPLIIPDFGPDGRYFTTAQILDSMSPSGVLDIHAADDKQSVIITTRLSNHDYIVYFVSKVVRELGLTIVMVKTDSEEDFGEMACVTFGLK